MLLKTLDDMEENISLHSQKLAILSRLIKESSLTLEEALLLLKEEEQPVIINTPGYTPPLQPSSPYVNSGTYWYSDTTLSGGIGVLTTTEGTSTITAINNCNTLTN